MPRRLASTMAVVKPCLDVRDEPVVNVMIRAVVIKRLGCCWQDAFLLPGRDIDSLPLRDGVWVTRVNASQFGGLNMSGNRMYCVRC